ncbi:MAG TPA: hypothetical protein VGD71_11915 [Kribbella sp.]|jgi:hypothetical protein
MADEDSPEPGMAIRIGQLQIDVPRSFGYYGAVIMAVACGIIEPPLGLFIAAIPVMKMFGKWDLPWLLRFASEVVDGAAQPVGGEAQGTIRLIDPQQDAARDIQTAESARRGEALKATRSARRRDAGAPA